MKPIFGLQNNRYNVNYAKKLFINDHYLIEMYAHMHNLQLFMFYLD